MTFMTKVMEGGAELRRLPVVALLILLLCLLVSGAASAADLHLFISCVDHSQPDRAVIHFGYTASDTVVGTSYIGPNLDIGIVSFPPNVLEAGEHPDVFVIEAYTESGLWQFLTPDGVAYELAFNRYSVGADCAALAEQWRPSAPAILIPAPGPGPYTLEVMDAFGHWSLVTDAAHPDGIVLYNKGGFVELIGSVGQDTDPTHYQLTEHAS